MYTMFVIVSTNKKNDINVVYVTELSGGGGIADQAGTQCRQVTLPLSWSPCNWKHEFLYWHELHSQSHV